MELIINYKDKAKHIKDLPPGSCFYDQVTDNFYILSSIEWQATNLENGNIESYDENDLVMPVKGQVIIKASSEEESVL